MKLSHLLIAALVTSSLIATAQTGPKGKKQKAKAKTEKKQLQPICIEKPAADTTNIQPRYCPACGRG